MQTGTDGRQQLLFLIVEAREAAQHLIRLGELAMALRLTEAGHQVDHPRIFVVGLARIVRLDLLETADVFRMDQGGLAAGAAGRMEQRTFVAAGTLAKHPHSAEAVALGKGL